MASKVYLAEEMSVIVLGFVLDICKKKTSDS